MSKKRARQVAMVGSSRGVGRRRPRAAIDRRARRSMRHLLAFTFVVLAIVGWLMFV